MCIVPNAQASEDFNGYLLLAHPNELIPPGGVGWGQRGLVHRPHLPVLLTTLHPLGCEAKAIDPRPNFALTRSMTFMSTLEGW